MWLQWFTDSLPDLLVGNTPNDCHQILCFRCSTDSWFFWSARCRAGFWLTRPFIMSMRQLWLDGLFECFSGWQSDRCDIVDMNRIIYIGLIVIPFYQWKRIWLSWSILATDRCIDPSIRGISWIDGSLLSPCSWKQISIFFPQFLVCWLIYAWP